MTCWLVGCRRRMIVNGRILLCAKLSSLMARLICTVPWGGSVVNSGLIGVTYVPYGWSQAPHCTLRCGFTCSVWTQKRNFTNGYKFGLISAAWVITQLLTCRWLIYNWWWFFVLLSGHVGRNTRYRYAAYVRCWGDRCYSVDFLSWNLMTLLSLYPWSMRNSLVHSTWLAESLSPTNSASVLDFVVSLQINTAGIKQWIMTGRTPVPVQPIRVFGSH